MKADAQLNDAVRRALGAIPEEVAHHRTEPPRLEDIYVVPGHEKALNPETGIVVGDRGSGKSFWCASLSGESSRGLIGRQFPRLHLDRVSVGWGFSAQRGHPGHPSRQVLDRLVTKGWEAEAIWRAVVLYQLLPLIGHELEGDWEARVRYVAEHPEQEEQWLADVDSQLRTRQQRHLIVFDALDRLGDDWLGIRQRLQGLLRVCLDLRSFPALRTKLFLRPDMWDDKTLWAFPDASKLHHNAVRLEWRRVDLYGLLWHWLANHQGQSGECFRRWCEASHQQRFSALPKDDGGSVFSLPSAMGTDERLQATMLNGLASEYMGTNRRRGRTYTWLPTHLADAKGKVSPRSFLLAIKRAEEASREKGTPEVLHYEGIKKGVSDASRVRLQELNEDYAWIEQVLAPLKGLTVPVTLAELAERWKAHDVIASISSARHTLPPHALEEPGAAAKPEEALVQSLIQIGVMSAIPDGRYNIPDLFRVAAGIGRRGGVRAIR